MVCSMLEICLYRITPKENQKKKGRSLIVIEKQQQDACELGPWRDHRLKSNFTWYNGFLSNTEKIFGK